MSLFYVLGHPWHSRLLLEKLRGFGVHGSYMLFALLIMASPRLGGAVVCRIQHTTFEHPDCGFPLECSGCPADVTFFSLDPFGFLGHAENYRLLLAVFGGLGVMDH